MPFKKIAKKILSKSPKMYTAAQTAKFESSHKQNFSNLNDEERNLLTTIKNQGFIVIPDFFSKSECESCITDMDWMYENKSQFIHKTDYSDLRIFGAEHLSETIMKFATHPLLNSLARHYNAVPTSCGFTLAGKITATGHHYGSGGPWHRDSYFRQFKSLMYLTDVDENHGPFQVISESHKQDRISSDSKTAKLDPMQCQFSQDVIDKIVSSEPERQQTLTAKAGTVVLVDTSCIHRGLPLNEGTRYALTNYFFENSQINQHLVEHFAPLVSPEKVLALVN